MLGVEERRTCGQLAGAERQVKIGRIDAERGGNIGRISTESVGIWSGAFVRPSAWRRGDRFGSGPATPASNGGTVAQPNEAGPDGCAIKGNISRKEKRIYHLPGTRWYAKMQINKTAGERWFYSEQDAVSAGWRRAGS